MRTIALVAVIVGVAQTASPEVQLSDFITVLGRVTTAAAPVENALVIALNLTNFSVIQTFSGPGGEFRLPPLRSAVYRIIAVKHGFAPTVATVLPTRKDQKISLQLQAEREASRSKEDEIWMIRSSLPSDVLRELDNVSAPAPAAVQVSSAPRLQTKMVSMTGVDSQTANQAVARTALGFSGDMGGGWKVDFEGRLNRLDDETTEGTIGTGISESRGVTMEVQSSPANSYRIASTRSTWRSREAVNEPGADIESHNFEWQHRDARVEVRYLAQENLFASRYDSELIEVAGRKDLQLSDRASLGVAVRLGQETAANAFTAPYRTADITTSGSFDAGRAVTLQYGVNSLVTEAGAEWSPNTSAEVKLRPNTSLIVSGSYKMAESVEARPTALVLWNQPSLVAPRYGWSVAFVNGNGDNGTFRAVASMAAIDSSIRVLFDDQFGQLRDGLFLEPGDIRRDVSLSYRRNVGRALVVDLSTSAGSAIPTGPAPASSERYYFTGVLQSSFRPTGTSFDVSYRQIDERMQEAGTTIERVNIQMGQSLRLPLDLRLLVGVELARAVNGQSYADQYDLQRRFLGGVSLAF